MKNKFMKYMLLLAVIVSLFTSGAPSALSEDAVSSEKYGDNFNQVVDDDTANQGNELNSEDGEQDIEGVLISRFELYNQNDKTIFYTGEEVLVHFGLSLSNDSSSLVNSTIEIEVPLTFIKEGSLEVSDILGQISKEIVYQDDKAIIRYKMQPVTNGYSVDTPLKFTIEDGTTPDGSQIPLLAKLITEDGTVLRQSESFIIHATTIKPKPEKFIKTTQGVNDIFVSNDGEIINLGLQSDVNPGYLSEDLDDLVFLESSFALRNNSSHGKRLYDKIEVVDHLPAGAIFVEEANPDWTYDSSTHTAKYVYQPENPFLLGQLGRSSLFTLKLLFPGAKIGDVLTNTMDFSLFVNNQADYENTLEYSDSIAFEVGEITRKPPTFSVRKSPNKYYDIITLYDTPEHRNRELPYYINVWNETSTEEHFYYNLENIVIEDYNLDPRLKFVRIEFDKARAPIGTVSLKIDYSDGTPSQQINNIDLTTSPKFVLENQENIEKLSVVFDEGTYLPPSGNFFIRIFTELRDKDIKVVANNESESRLINHMKVTGNYEDFSSDILEQQGYILYKEFSPYASIRKRKAEASNTFFINDNINFSLSLNLGGFTPEETKFEDPKIIDLLPVGLEYVVGSSSFTVPTDPKLVTDMPRGESLIEPEVIHNFKNTGRTALIWNLDTISFMKDEYIPLYLQAVLIQFKTKVTYTLQKGLVRNTAYLSWGNTDTVVHSGNPYEDVLDLNENGDLQEILTYEDLTFNYEPPRELIVKKEVKGSLDSQFLLNPARGTSEINSITTYRLTLYNNSIVDYTELFLLDVNPYVGDRTISSDVDPDIPGRLFRNSTYKLDLFEEISVPEGFKVYYTIEDPDAYETSQDFYNNAVWVDSLADYSQARAFKVEMEEGHIFRSGHINYIDVKYITPSDKTFNADNQAVNSFGISISPNLDFFESNYSINQLVKYTVEGKVFEDVNGNNLIDESDSGLENHPVKLLNEEGLPVYENGEPVIVHTDENGFYRFEVFESGNYMINVETPSGYQLIDLSDSSQGSGSHINSATSTTDLFELSVDNSSQVRNAGYKSVNIDITANKVWVNGPSTRPTIELQLYRDGVAVGDPVSLEDGETEYTWVEMPVTDINGEAYEYTVDEVNTPDNYSKTVDGLTVTNTYVVPTKDVTANKVWVNGPSTRPTIELQLYRDGVAVGDPVSLEDGTLTYTWVEMPVTDINGEAYEYTVDEVNTPENYSKTVDGLTVTNTYVVPTKDVTANKVWVNGPSTRPTIELQLYRDGVAVGDPVSLEDGTLTYTWVEMPVTDINGEAYEYTVDEVNTPENYSKTVEGLTVTNTYVVPTKDVTANKVWVNGPTTRPTIELQLYRDGVAVGDPVSLEDGETEYTWVEMPVTDINGEAYEYTVDEVNIPENYSKTVDGLTITNTYVVPTKDVTANKVWVNGPTTRPTIELQLYRDGVAVGDPVSLEDGETEYTWVEMPVTDINGEAYEYTVDEVNTPENYSKTVDGLTVTNTYVVPTKDVTANKVWVNGPSTRPTIELQLYRDGVAVGDPVSLEDGTLTYTWVEMPVTDINGEAYEYTVDEVNIPENYSKTVDGLTVTNTYVGDTLPNTGSGDIYAVYIGAALMALGVIFLIVGRKLKWDEDEEINYSEV